MGAASRLALAAAIATCAVLALAPRPAAAQQCRLTVVPVAFGTYDPFDVAPRDVTGSIQHRCPPPRAIQILLDRGGSATFAPREMRSGSYVLAYNLYLDPPSTPGARIWGDGSGGTYGYAGTGNATVTVYGRVFPLQDVAVGAYSDTITITAIF